MVSAVYTRPRDDTRLTQYMELVHHALPVDPLTERVDWYPGAGPRQCIAKNNDETRCRRSPVRGSTVCVLHGGASPLAKQSAQRLLLTMVEPAAATLFRAIERCAEDPDKPGSCVTHGADGCPEWPARINAAKALLDRAGFGPQAKLTVTDETSDVRNLDTRELANELEALSAELRSRGPRHEVIDAEVVKQ